MMKRSRKDYTPEMVGVLEEAWNSGMRFAGKKCLDKINDIASLLSIPVDSVKEWIGNRNAKERRENGVGKPVVRKAALGSGTNAYSLFAKTVKRGTMDGPSYMKLISEKWGELNEEGKEEYRKKALDIRNDPMKGQPRETVIFSQLKLINQACEILQSVGYEVCGMGYDKSQQSAPSVFGSSEGMKFLDIDIQDQFRIFITGKVAIPEHADPESFSSKQRELRQRVRKHLNTSWTNSTNLKSAIPYKEIMDGKLEVDIQGLPDGVTFKDPSCYGTNTLTALLGCQIIFKIRNGGGKDDEEDAVIGVKKRKLEKKQNVKGTVIEQASTSKSGAEVESSEDILERIASEPSNLENVHDLSQEQNLEDSPVIPVEIAEDMASMLGVVKVDDDVVVSLTEENTGSCLVDTCKGKKSKMVTGAHDRKGKRKLEKKRSKKGCIFEIDCLVEDREGEDGYEYLVQWKGFTEEERTWEPESALPPESLTFYHRKKICKEI